jgi:glutathione S-transferase
MMAETFTIYGDLSSGNCLKVLWVARFLGLAHEWVDVDVMSDNRPDVRRTRRADFLAMNPVGEVPVVAWPDGRTLAQSNAIIRYLARGSALLPDDPFAQAKIDEWLFWEQYSHEPYIAVCRKQVKYLGKSVDEREPWRVQRGEAALDRLEAALRASLFLAGETLTIADVALVAYTRLAHEGGFDLTGRPNLRAWIARCETALGISTKHSVAA